MPTLKISLSGNRSLLATYSLAGARVRSWIVYLPESGADFQGSRRSDLNHILGPSLANQFNYLIINKPGIFPQRKNHIVFERSFRRQLRIRDALTTITEIVPQDHEIYLIG
jgi:hypothetical protein